MKKREKTTQHIRIQSESTGSVQVDPQQKLMVHKRLSGELFCDLNAQSIVVFNVPDPDTPDPHAFGPPGSGSYYHQAKIVRKTLILVLCDIFWTFYFLKNEKP
jgi:hypothetical protein